MKRFWLLILSVLSVSIVGSQEVKHAPTVAQCRADQRMWLSKLGQTGASDPIVDVSYKEMFDWERELMDCKRVDHPNNNGYFITAAAIDAERASRLASFLYRHGLMDQFYAEDAQGKGR
jgi:hypothetical protein